MARGKILIGLMLVIAAAMAGYAWWHSFHQGRRCLRLWGTEAAYLIRFAPTVELLANQEDSAASLPAWDISRIPGLVHARHALISDASYVWDAAASRPAASIDDDARGDFALRFVDGSRVATLVFHFEQAIVRHAESGAAGRLAPYLRAAFQRRCTDWSEQARQKVNVHGQTSLPFQPQGSAALPVLRTGWLVPAYKSVRKTGGQDVVDWQGDRLAGRSVGRAIGWQGCVRRLSSFA